MYSKNVWESGIFSRIKNLNQFFVLQVPVGSGCEPAGSGGSMPGSNDRCRSLRSLFRRHDCRHQKENFSHRGRWEEICFKEFSASASAIDSDLRHSCLRSGLRGVTCAPLPWRFLLGAGKLQAVGFWAGADPIPEHPEETDCKVETNWRSRTRKSLSETIS